jgi:hypothetical protein
VSKFKVGDKVKLIKYDEGKEEGWAKIDGLVVGEIYTVYEVHSQSITVREGIKGYWISKRCFRKIDNQCLLPGIEV